jgi:hypothetical protein
MNIRIDERNNKKSVSEKLQLCYAVTFILVVSGMVSGNHWARRPEE